VPPITKDDAGWGIAFANHAGDFMRVKFPPSEGFYTLLKGRVEEYFQRTGHSRHDNPRMYIKVAILLTWYVASYLLLLLVADAGWQAVLLSVSLGLAMAGIGFNLGHDGGHGSISSSPFVNRLLARTFDVMGASSYVWHWKHNVFHHTFPNIMGADEDIDAEPMARLSPHQPYHPHHRFQYLYMWLLYGFLPVKWQFYDDFKCIIRSRIARNPFPRPRGWQLAGMLVGKALFVGWAIVLPLMLHSVWLYLGCFALASLTLGVTLSVVFQLAHATEQADFLAAPEGSQRCEHEWAVHQVLTTVDFARANPFLNWYLGGLNYQIEHHLFPHVPHIHYPALSAIVEATCKEHGVRYFAHAGFFGALASHQRWLRRMGRPDSILQPAPTADAIRSDLSTPEPEAPEVMHSQA
jgi:linoleoyl-CoA desaturase